MIEYADLHVLARLKHWLDAGQDAWLCTVVKTWGSSPRPVGSLLCCNAEGQMAGSLSGGCIEEDLLEKLLAGKLALGKPALHIYGATQDEAERFQLPCGGQLHLVIESFPASAFKADSGNNSVKAKISQLVARLEARQCVTRILDLESGEFTVADTDRFQHLRLEIDPADPASSQQATGTDNSATASSKQAAGTDNSATAISQQAAGTDNSATASSQQAAGTDNSATASSQHEAGTEQSDTKGMRLTQVYGPRYRLFLIGAGHVSICLAQMALMLDYEVLVCDPREEMISQWPLPGVQLLQAMPDDAVKAHANDPATAIVALTHDPRIDDMGLMEALKTDAWFVGAMGSTRTAAKRRERLQLLDLSEAEVDRLQGPVGLPIGSKTPAEIALSILAQLTSLRQQPAYLKGGVEVGLEKL